MNDNALVVQHNSVIEARYRLTVEEQRLIKTLVSKIEASDEDFKVYEIRIADLARMLGISDTSYYERIKKVTRKIVSNSLSFTDINGNEIQTNWLSSVKYYKGKGVVALRFDPELKPYLLQLKSFFTSYKLVNILQLKGMYSIRIYELLKQYEKIGRREFSVDELRNVLGINAEYPQYRDFKKFVLAPAEKEISEKTDIKYSVKEITSGRKVMGLIFTISSVAKTKSIATQDMANQSINVVVNNSSKNAPDIGLAGVLVAVGVEKKVAENLVKEYPEERIKAAIAYTQAQQKEGKVKNPSGFVVEAIKNEYRDNQAEERAQKEKAAQDTKACEEHAQRWKRLKTAYAEAKKATFEVWRSSLSEQALAEHREKFMETLAPMLRKSKNIIEQAFLAYLSSLMPFPSLREWAGQSRLNIAEFEQEVAQDERQAAVASAKG